MWDEISEQQEKYIVIVWVRAKQTIINENEMKCWTYAHSHKKIVKEIKREWHQCQKSKICTKVGISRTVENEEKLESTYTYILHTGSSEGMWKKVWHGWASFLNTGISWSVSSLPRRITEKGTKIEKEVRDELKKEEKTRAERNYWYFYTCLQKKIFLIFFVQF